MESAYLNEHLLEQLTADRRGVEPCGSNLTFLLNSWIKPIEREPEMTEKKRSCDAVEWAYNRYIKGKPEQEAAFEEAGRQADLAQQVYDIRNKFHMTREDLAEFSGLTPEAVEDIEESDYDGNWDEAIDKINSAFHRWFQEVIQPAARMTEDEYSVKTVNA
jgi:DNA-binding XRE family transcriptional regulator